MEHNYATQYIETNESTLLIDQESAPLDSTSSPMDYETTDNNANNSTMSIYCPSQKSLLKRPYCEIERNFEKDDNMTVFSESEDEVDIKFQHAENEIVDQEPDVFRLEDLCRVCAKSRIDMVEIFGTEGMKCGLQDKMNLCLPIKVTPEDTLPLRVCRHCMSSLDLSHSLATMCLEAERTLSNMQREHQQLFENLPSLTDTTSADPISVASAFIDEGEEPNNERENNKVFICPVCEENITSLCVFTAHCQVNHGLYFCDNCHQLFNDDKQLASHKKKVCPVDVHVQLDLSNLKCITCSKLFNSISNYKKHITEQPCKDISCNLSENFANFSSNETASYSKNVQPDLNKDYGLSEEKYDFACTLCSLKFYTKYHLKSHYKLKHECHLCLGCVNFVTPSVQKFHKHITEVCNFNMRGIKNYKPLNISDNSRVKCDLCTGIVLLDSIYSLVYHYEELHKLYFCILCINFVTDNLEEMNEHEKSHEINNYNEVSMGKSTLHPSFEKYRAQFNCKYCNFMTYSKHLLNSHHKESHSLCLLERRIPPASENVLAGRLDNIPLVFKCKICNECFPNDSQLKTHYKLHHGFYVCYICIDFTSNNLKDLKLHLQKHRKANNDYQCEKCGENYKKASNLKYHILNEHYESAKMFQCSICDKIFEYKNLFKKHLLTHRPKKVKCSECDELFQTAEQMIIHKEIHCTNYSCKFCDQKFKKESSLSGHILKIHNKKWFYNCVICKSEYYDKDNVIKHFNTHSDEDKVKHLNIYEKTSLFKCSNCCKYYGNNYSLRNHKCIKVNKPQHQNIQSSPQTLIYSSNVPEQQNICEYCEKVFTNKKKLKFHIRYKHFNPEQYSCKFCDETFYNLSGLKSHKNIQHAAERQLYKCTYCDKTYKNKHNMLKHMKIHDVSSVTEVNPCTEKVLDITETEDVINLEETEDIGTLVTGTEIGHTGSNVNYNCIICNARFRTEKDVINHFNSHDDVDKIKTLKIFTTS